MKQSDRVEFGKLMSEVMAYYGKDASKFVLDLWFSSCEPFEIEVIRKALTGHAKDAERGVFAPKIADIVRQLAGTRTDRAMLAWGRVFEAMGSIGAYTDVVFDDPAIHAVIEDLGGWPKVCRYPSEEISYLQHNFCTSHKAYTQSGAYAYPARLMGDRSPDGEYERRGLPLPAPVVIGDVDAAGAVYSGGSLAGRVQMTKVKSLADLAGRALQIGVQS